jgi:hypothetical protein
MPSPFPGMDPYLEAPEISPDFHDSDHLLPRSHTIVPAITPDQASWLATILQAAR